VTDDEARWAEALTSLERGPTDDVRRRVRRTRLLAAGIAAAVVIVGLLGPVLLPDGSDEPSRSSVPQELRITGLVVMVVAVVVEGLALFRMWGALRGRWHSPLAALTQCQNKQLLAMVRGTEPPDPVRLPLARHLAGTMLIQRPIVAMLAGSALLWAGLTLMKPSAGRILLSSVFVLVFAFGAWAVRRNERQARRFLAEHPDDGPGT
jgi:hypothetical protein